MDSMLKDIATIILSTVLLIGWVAFIITYPLVKLSTSPLPSHVSPNLCAHHPMSARSAPKQQTSTFLLTFKS